MSLGDILAQANKAYPKIKSSVIILDSCHSGYAGEVAGLGNEDVSLIGTGVTILTASHREGVAEEGIKHGLRSEEHKSELQALMRNSYAGICLKKKKTSKSAIRTQARHEI